MNPQPARARPPLACQRKFRVVGPTDTMINQCGIEGLKPYSEARSVLPQGRPAANSGGR